MIFIKIKEWFKKVCPIDMCKSMTLCKYFVIIVVATTIIVYFLQSKSDDIIDVTPDQDNEVATSTNTIKPITNKTSVVSAITTPSKYSSSKCNFKIITPQIYSKITIPLSIKGILDKADLSNGCTWNENLSRAGQAELFYNRNGEGWKSAGTSVPIITSSLFNNTSTTTLAFSVSINLYTQALGLTSGTPIKIVFTELNILENKNPNTFEILYSLK
jgi:hypothetical protein